MSYDTVKRYDWVVDLEIRILALPLPNNVPMHRRRFRSTPIRSHFTEAG